MLSLYDTLLQKIGTELAPPLAIEDTLSPVDYAAYNFKVMDKQDKIVALTYNPIQRNYLHKRTGRDLILKARQFGMSTAIQAEFVRLAATETARTLTLANSDDNTQKLRRMASRFIEYMPNPPALKSNNATITSYVRTGSEATIATAGNKNSGRAGSYRFIHCSEAAFYPDLQSIIASALQAGSPEWVVLESTPNGAQGRFYELCMEALDPKAGSIWTLHFYPWFKHAEYQLPVSEPLQYSDEELMLIEKHGLSAAQIQWRRLKIKELTPRLFQQEYPEDPVTCFLTSGASVFGDFSHALYMPPLEDKPTATHLYVAGVDWGQSANYTSLSIMDADDNREVCLGRWHHMRWDEMRAEIARLCDFWQVQKVYAERNSASSNVEALRDDLERLQKDYGTARPSASVMGFTMTNKSKSALVAGLYEGIHKGGLKLLDIPYATAEMRSFQSVQSASGAWTYDSPETDDGGHGDTVIARMAAYRGVIRRIPENW